MWEEVCFPDIDPIVAAGDPKVAHSLILRIASGNLAIERALDSG